jgi:hypothetical protein
MPATGKVSTTTAHSKRTEPSYISHSSANAFTSGIREAHRGKTYAVQKNKYWWQRPKGFLFGETVFSKELH